MLPHSEYARWVCMFEDLARPRLVQDEAIQPPWHSLVELRSPACVGRCLAQGGGGTIVKRLAKQRLFEHNGRRNPVHLSVSRRFHLDWVSPHSSARVARQLINKQPLARLSCARLNRFGPGLVPCLALMLAGRRHAQKRSGHTLKQNWFLRWTVDFKVFAIISNQVHSHLPGLRGTCRTIFGGIVCVLARPEVARGCVYCSAGTDQFHQAIVYSNMCRFPGFVVRPDHGHAVSVRQAPQTGRPMAMLARPEGLLSASLAWHCCHSCSGGGGGELFQARWSFAVGAHSRRCPRW